MTNKIKVKDQSEKGEKVEVTVDFTVRGVTEKCRQLINHHKAFRGYRNQAPAIEELVRAGFDTFKHKF